MRIYGHRELRIESPDDFTSEELLKIQKVFETLHNPIVNITYRLDIYVPEPESPH